jgi:hypothetical protein
MSRNYVIKKTGGYIVVVEGEEERHLEKSDTDPTVKELIRKLEVLLKARRDAGLEISDLFIKKLGISTSNSFATHTTGAGDYEESHRKRKKK